MTKKSKSMFILRWAKKIKLINSLGGCCQHCRNTNIEQLTFHHTNPKTKSQNITNLIQNRFSEALKEAKKCLLLCENCHRKIHNKISPSKDLRSTKNKELFLEYKQTNKCKQCNKTYPITTLDFHHTNNKLLTLAKINTRFSTSKPITKTIKDELDKCDVLCANCHASKHFLNERFQQFKIEIYTKVHNMSEQPPKYNVEKILEMYNSGIIQSDIAKTLGAAKSTISGIIKNNKERIVG